jgi:hypothetical protein
MRNILLAGAVAILAVPAAISAQTPGTPPADQTGSNTATMPPAGTPPPATMAPPPSSPDAGPAPNAAPDTMSATNTAPPPDAMNKTYPVCTKKIQDECRNRGGK